MSTQGVANRSLFFVATRPIGLIALLAEAGLADPL